MNESERFRLSRLVVDNYKSIDHIDFKFNDISGLDVLVLGSENGVGKTSFLESCALAVLASFVEFRMRLRDLDRRERNGFDLKDIMIRAGADKTDIKAKIQYGDVVYDSSLEMSNDLGLVNSSDLGLTKALAFKGLDVDSAMRSIVGLISEPVVLPPLLFFHSYRKVVEGSLYLGAMTDIGAERERRFRLNNRSESVLSLFKITFIQALMASRGLFEGITLKGDSEQTLSVLNGLLERFAGGSVDKLKTAADGSLELRVRKPGSEASFSFDGLSSGQKEIITTLFLIWYNTHDCPSVVLIDEPEMHLNAQWQRIFIEELEKIAPQNQYIIATHSEEIYASVASDRRIMLEPKGA